MAGAENNENINDTVAEKKTTENENAAAEGEPDSKKIKTDEEEKTNSAGTEVVVTKSAVDEGKNPTKLELDIIRQIEYYFGDANLFKDSYLNGLISATKEGWVFLTDLIRFKRLAQLSTDPDVVVNALSKSGEGLIEISDDRTQLRRHPERPVPEFNREIRQERQERSVYVKGFPLDSTIENMLEYFQSFQKVENVIMRKYYDRNDKQYKFKGSVFVTFEKKEQAEEFLKNKELKYKENDFAHLVTRWQLDYQKEKAEERATKQKKREGKGKPEEKAFVLPSGTVLFFEGVTKDDTDREDIRQAIEVKDPESEVAYIDFKRSDKEGKVRFRTEGQASKFLEKLEGNKLTVKEEEITLRTLEKDEETEFLAQVVDNMRNLRKNSRRFHNKGRRHSGFKRDYRGNKKQKVADGGGDAE